MSAPEFSVTLSVTVRGEESAVTIATRLAALVGEFGARREVSHVSVSWVPLDEEETVETLSGERITL